MSDARADSSFKLCCICENGGKSSFTFGVDKRRLRNINNSSSATVMLRDIALAYESITTWTLS